MRTEHTYRWSVIVGGKPRTTLAYLTQAEVWRDYPEGQPQRIDGTLQMRDVPESAEEALAQWLRAPGNPD